MLIYLGLAGLNNKPIMSGSCSVFSFLGDTMRQRIKFTDERVCKSHLLDSCPHDILSGTVSIMFIHTRTGHYHVPNRL